MGTTPRLRRVDMLPPCLGDNDEAINASSQRWCFVHPLCSAPDPCHTAPVVTTHMGHGTSTLATNQVLWPDEDR